MPTLFNRLLAVAAAFLTGIGAEAQTADVANRTASPTAGGDRNAVVERATRRRMLANARTAAATRAKEALAAKGGKVDPKTLGANPTSTAFARAAGLVQAGGTLEGLAVPGPGFQLAQPDYMFGTASNWHNTKPIHKFVDTLAGLGPDNANNLGNYIPVATPDTTTYPGSDYYQIGVVEYKQQLHSELAPTKLRGYVDLTNPSLNTVNGGASNYLGPVIIARRDRPVRVKMVNQLPSGPVDPATGRRPGDLFIPVDTTMMGAGLGPLSWTKDPATGKLVPTGNLETYPQNRAELHLHGGLNPWISDGTPHQWVTPAGEATSYKKGAAFQNVPDMASGASDGDGIGTYYWTNQQSGRFMFYHDHSFGLTRLNVYAGEAAGYMIVDPVEDKLIAKGILPTNSDLVKPGTPNFYQYGVPLVIQDKTFVNTATLGTVGVAGGTDPTWDVNAYGGDGSLWYPHVYMPNQNPADLSGANAMGRWDYGPWFWPPVTAAAGLVHGAEPVVGDPNGTEIPGTPNPSLVPEAFMDTPVVNGTAYPRIEVQPKAYRFRILNAANDRFWNLSFFTGDPAGNLDASGKPTEVKMVTAAPGNPAWPATWPTDGRDGGVPDPATAGPSFLQIGNESGFLPTPVEIKPQPVAYNYNRRDIVVLNVQEKALFLGPAERADVIVDFSNYAGQTLILYNDSPAPVPAFDPRLDYYTGDPDQTDAGGAASTLPGFGPNTRTIMRFEVAAGTAQPYDTAALMTAFQPDATTGAPSAFKAMQHPPIIPQTEYNSAMGTNVARSVYGRIQDNRAATPFPSTENGDLVQPYFEPKAIQELFELDYGRMNATLGVELPFTNFNIQTTIPLGYADPTTENLQDGTTQYWKITHNGVDTHPVHFHLFDVQIMNRVGWDGAVRFPEANELGWKETVKMNPLEDIIVAFRPISPRLPFALPNSLRSPNVIEPADATISVTNPVDGNPINISNAPVNFGWEYVWHCHILGHEENDFMRSMVLNVATEVPAAPTTLAALVNGAISTRVDLTWTDNATNETGFSIQRRAGGSSDAFAEIATVVPNVRSYSDFDVIAGAPYEYQVVAYNQAGVSLPSNSSAINTPSNIQVGGVIKHALTGAGLAGVTVTFPDAVPAVVATTDANGYYSAVVPYLYTGAIVPTLAGFTFNPTSRTVTNVNTGLGGQDFTAIPGITLAGKVSFGTGGLAGATVTTSTGLTATTDAAGNYAFAIPASAPVSLSITARKTGYFITPFSLSVTGAISDNLALNFTAVNGYTQSGRVTTNTGVALAGVTLTFASTNTPPVPTLKATTDATGAYSMLVPTGWTGTLTPSLAGYAFNPVFRSLGPIVSNATNLNFTARPTILASGTVTTAGQPLAGVRVTFNGTGGGVAVTDGTGHYALAVDSGWTGTITPSLTGYAFGPANVVVTTPLTTASSFNFVTVQTISGRTRNRAGNNIAGVTITAKNADGTVYATTLTNGNGNYTLTVPTGWNGTVNASGILLTWTPVGYTYSGLALNMTNQNFTGQ